MNRVPSFGNRVSHFLSIQQWAGRTSSAEILESFVLRLEIWNLQEFMQKFAVMWIYIGNRRQIQNRTPFLSNVFFAGAAGPKAASANASDNYLLWVGRSIYSVIACGFWEHVRRGIYPTILISSFFFGGSGASSILTRRYQNPAD